MLRELFRQTLDAAAEYDRDGNEAMRGREARLAVIAAVVQSWLASEAELGIEALDLRTGTGGFHGSYAPVPWVRIFNQTASPRPTGGFYLVYLFAGSGELVYLSLNQGTSEWRSGKWRPVTSPAELTARAAAARDLLADVDSPILVVGETELDLKVANMAVGAESKLRVRNYELANVYGLPYHRADIPEDDALRADLFSMVGLLGDLYGVEQTVDVPPGRHRRYRHMNTAAKNAVESYAVQEAMRYFCSLGYDVDDVGDRESFDLICRLGDIEIHVECKGLVAGGEEITLSRNEVQHAHTYPWCALFIQAEIKLDWSDPQVPKATGGTSIIRDPWTINDAGLIPLSYRYTV
ncbi:MAG: hypothetical protein QOF60_384 [Actinomycetota bacterium]|jgi:hypothetical protein|nr:hypothetical protein [Actinomycetota bacterium]